MVSVLVEGVSGSGKTTVCRELQRRGVHAVNGDTELAYQGDPVTGEPTDGFRHEHHIWPVETVRRLLADAGEDLIVLCGGSRNWSRFLDLFDVVIALHVDRATLERRLEQRPPDEFGGTPEQRAMVLRLHGTQEDVPPGIPLDATRPIVEIVDDVLRLARR